ncbi:hypothetical protein E2C01_066261 [Portunus trituberculatus]|uniref:Uncharacterized protein n=1 Tax=Portunus trituberculatus TaxID=210409 RepID=A0A5B7HQG3_PORTR|nr:hypothetical protein [Portunus trituberculatus]
MGRWGKAECRLDGRVSVPVNHDHYRYYYYYHYYYYYYYCYDRCLHHCHYCSTLCFVITIAQCSYMLHVVSLLNGQAHLIIPN